MTAKIQPAGLIERLQAPLARSGEPRTPGGPRDAEGSEGPGASPAPGAGDVVTLSPHAVHGAASGEPGRDGHPSQDSGRDGARLPVGAAARPLDADGVQGALGAIRALAAMAPAAMAASHAAADPARLLPLVAG